MRCLALFAAAILTTGTTFAQPREFPIGSLHSLGDLPASRLRTQLQSLPETAQRRGFQWLQSVHFTEADLASLSADSDGGIFYVCSVAKTGEPTDELPPIGQAAAPVSPFPSSLVFHSKPGAPNVLYINFAGETVVNSQWNTEIGRAEIPAVPFSTDSDLANFSDTEQVIIKRVWQRMAEDYAPFNVDVTTERPASFGIRTAQALITRTTDANGNANPFSEAGGVAYVNVFGTSTYARYRPAWIYHNNLGNTDANIAEAASHEIGHNLGLSHDGKTDGTEYYGGHGSGDTSWGPLMGTGYGRNVSQWCKGDYYLANNTQDDLAIIAGKLTYRTDDHGNTAGTATALKLTGTNLVSTTPENDPANTNTANKGVIERAADVDVFSFVTGNGPINLSVRPWITAAGTRGGNLDLEVALYNETGALLLTNNPALQTTALIQTNLAEGRYYVHVRDVGFGTPLSSAPSGYTAYGSVGQYFWSGYVTAPANFVVRPMADLQVTDINAPGQTTQSFTVTYSDNLAVAISTLGANDLRVTGPNGYDQMAQFVTVDVAGDGTPRVATYSVAPPSGSTWMGSANGTYTIWMQTNQVSDTEGAWVLAGQLGQFQVAVPTVIYSSSMDTDPGWTLESPWQYGTPSYSSGGPTGGFTGNRIIGLNLSGNYANNQPTRYATTPVLNCSGASSVTLRFRRWLRTKNNDAVSIQVTTNQTTWTEVWSSVASIADTSWQQVQYTLPAGVAGSSSVRLRWALASNQSQNDLGWNIDDVELLAGGSLDTAPPVPVLSVADITTAGSPTHACSVTYTDSTAIRLASLDSSDLVVTGPGGYSNTVEFIGADLPSDGSPISASYSIPAPGGSWDAGDNGLYQVVLVEDQVADIYDNPLPRTALGSFDVLISNVPPAVQLTVTANNPAWGSVTPSGGSYPSGSSVQLSAAPNPYFRFDRWSGALSGTNNPSTLVVQSNTTVQAVFAEVITTGYATPHWWLAAQNYTNDFEFAATQLGANGMPLWQSYIAGLDPQNPQSQLRLSGRSVSANGAFVLSWNTVTGRVYTVSSAPNPAGSFTPLPGALDLPASVQSYTNADNSAPARFYRLQVKKITP